LDQNVATFVFKNAIQGMLKERGKLVVVCTHHTKYLKEADYVVRMSQEGGVEQIGI
jgi:ABC-type siderophore export system fused ATPase/permease subunit